MTRVVYPQICGHEVGGVVAALGEGGHLLHQSSGAPLRQRVNLDQIFEDKADGILSEVWNLVQLNPGGELIIPASPRVEYTDYFEPVDAAHQTIAANHVRLRITGQQRYKVGYKAAHLTGRLAYLNRLDAGRSYLIVRNFFNNPSAGYAEEPAGRPGRNGHSVHVYNDGGGFGGFGELECTGQTIGGATGRAASMDRMVFWLYVGAHARLREIAVHLLGVDPQASEPSR